jgi:hypothetical protein
MATRDCRRCARCGREPTPSEMSEFNPSSLFPFSGTDDRPEPSGRVLIEGPAWTSIESEDVCSACLTLDEERQLALDIIARIERAMAQKQYAGDNPEPYEAILIAYAQMLRERLARQPESWD